MTAAPLSTAAFDALLQSLGRIRDEYVNNPVRQHDELEAVEGFAYALQMVGHVSEFLCEADRERPRFSLIVSPARKILGDNADSIYHQAAIRGDRAYRIRGRRTGQCYISFTVHGTGLVVEVSADSASGRPPSTGTFSWIVMKALVDEVSADVQDGRLTLRLSLTRSFAVQA